MLGLAVTAGTAWASSTSWKDDTQTVSSKAQFKGSYKWHSAGDDHGGFEIKGNLYDLNKSNNRGVKFQVHIERYANDVYKAQTDHDRSIPDVTHWTGDETYVNDAYYQTCQVNTINPDDCTSWKHVSTPYSN